MLIHTFGLKNGAIIGEADWNYLHKNKHISIYNQLLNA